MTNASLVYNGITHLPISIHGAHLKILCLFSSNSEKLYYAQRLNVSLVLIFYKRGPGDKIIK